MTAATVNDRVTYDAILDRSTVWILAKIPRRLLHHFEEGAAHYWKALFWIPGRVA